MNPLSKKPTLEIHRPYNQKELNWALRVQARPFLLRCAMAHANLYAQLLNWGNGYWFIYNFYMKFLTFLINRYNNIMKKVHFKVTA